MRTGLSRDLAYERSNRNDMHNLTRLFIAAAILLLSGCSGVDISTYADNRPRFDIFSYFSGDTRGWGIVQDRSGEMTRQFVVDIVGETNEAGELVLTEDFLWNDGERSRRIWTIAREGDNSFSGTASDVIGSASGISAGNALNWSYVLALEVDGSTWEISFDDWMFLQEDGVLLNRATMSKFGLTVGEVIIAFKKVEIETGA